MMIAMLVITEKICGWLMLITRMQHRHHADDDGGQRPAS